MTKEKATTDVGTIRTVEELEDRLSEPTEELIESLDRIEGDILILGAAGKMGPTLARMAKRAADTASARRRVIAVSRFSNRDEQSRLEDHGIETISFDVLGPGQLEDLPDAPNLIYMIGTKFGSSGNEALTWATNSYLPGLVCRRYPASRIVAFSTGNIYGLTPVAAGGPDEGAAPNPDGEYAMSCVGRERMFEHFCRTTGTPVSLIRLNYACELRYGVLVDLAQNVWARRPIDLSMGAFNTIWQGDANAVCLRALEHTASPPFVLNVTGTELLSIREVSEQFGAVLDRPVQFTGIEAPDALISNAGLCQNLFGTPRVSVRDMIRLIADWVRRDGPTLGKPTHFEVRDGKF